MTAMKTHPRSQSKLSKKRKVNFVNRKTKQPKDQNVLNPRKENILTVDRFPLVPLLPPCVLLGQPGSVISVLFCFFLCSSFLLFDPKSVLNPQLPVSMPLS